MAKTTFFITVKASVKGVPYPIPYTFHFKKKVHIGQAFEELCKKTNRSLNNLPPITKVETHTRKEGLIKIYG